MVKTTRERRKTFKIGKKFGKKIYFGFVQTSNFNFAKKNFKLESGISSEGTIKNLKGRPTVQTSKVFIKEKLVLIMKTKPKLGVQIS